MTPRFVRLFVVMVALVAAFCWLGQWQWRVAHDNATRTVLNAANEQKRVPIDDVLKPGADFVNSTSLRPVRAVGRFDSAHTVLVAGRVLNGKNGWWLVTPLVVDSSGARLPVLRGFVTSTTGLPAPASGRVTVDGALAPGESAATDTNLPSGQIGTIDMGLLLNTWGGTVYNAFVFETAQHPAGPLARTAVTPVPPPLIHKSSLQLQNAAYAVQWYVFAGFAIYMWFKMVWDESRLRELANAPDPSTTDPENEDA